MMSQILIGEISGMFEEVDDLTALDEDVSMLSTLVKVRLIGGVSRGANNQSFPYVHYP